MHCYRTDSTFACCSMMHSAFCNFLIYDGEEEGPDLDEDESLALNEVHACTINTHTHAHGILKKYSTSRAYPSCDISGGR